MIKRCKWVNLNNPLYIKYHDEEWGVPVHDDKKLFEFIVLESAQAGLSWETILNRREGYRKAFCNFDVRKVANLTYKDVERFMTDTGIIRNRLKIQATITNAQAFLVIQKEFGSFSTYLWNWIGNKPIMNLWKNDKLPAYTDTAEAISKDMKGRGFKFFGPTICYAHMQACGMVNDHSKNCFRYSEIK